MNAYEYSWHEQFYYFTLFRVLNGPEATPGKDSDVPVDDETYCTQADLSAWIRDQNHSRKNFLDGKASDITANQIKVLDSVSFPWIRDSSERWDGHFKELIAYKEEHGHCNVPRKVGKLGIWVKNQRAAYHKLLELATGGEGGGDVKKTTAVITPDQIQLLTDLGFQWKIRPDHGDAWTARYEELKAYKQEHGHCRISPTEDSTLGEWCKEQRARYKRKVSGKETKRKISDQQIAMLEEVGFEWSGGFRKGLDPEERKLMMEERKAKEIEERKRKRAELKEQKERARAAEKQKKKEEKAKKRAAAVLKKLDERVAKRLKKEAEAEAKKKQKKASGKPKAAKPKAANSKAVNPKAANPMSTMPQAKKRKRNTKAALEKSVDRVAKAIEKKLAAENIPVVPRAAVPNSGTATAAGTKAASAATMNRHPLPSSIPIPKASEEKMRERLARVRAAAGIVANEQGNSSGRKNEDLEGKPEASSISGGWKNVESEGKPEASSGGDVVADAGGESAAGTDGGGRDLEEGLQGDFTGDLYWDPPAQGRRNLEGDQKGVDSSHDWC